MVRDERWIPAYVGIGGNLDGPIRRVCDAIDSLAQLKATRLMAASSLYRSDAVGPGSQPDYINAVAALLTTLPAVALLESMQAIEAEHGRERGAERWTARTLDLDLLVFGGQTADSAALILPHPRIQERNFVLLPLAELAPDLVVPGLGTVRTLLASNDNSVPTIERLDENPYAGNAGRKA